jgi:hypothetical protein
MDLLKHQTLVWFFRKPFPYLNMPFLTSHFLLVFSQAVASAAWWNSYRSVSFMHNGFHSFVSKFSHILCVCSALPHWNLTVFFPKRLLDLAFTDVRWLFSYPSLMCWWAGSATVTHYPNPDDHSFLWHANLLHSLLLFYTHLLLMENLGTWLPTSAVSLSHINI